MKALNFKTNPTTAEPVAAASQALNDIGPIDGWNIDLDRPDKLLPGQAIGQAGYQARLVGAWPRIF